MQGKRSKSHCYLQLLLLGFVFFSFSFKFSLQEGKLALAYNTHNLERGPAYEKLVQSSEGNQNVEGDHINDYIRIF